MTNKINKNYCMSSYLVFRYIVDDDVNFYPGLFHRTYKLKKNEDKMNVENERDVDFVLKEEFAKIKDKKIGILLSGGMDSACLASYMPGTDAYTFRFYNGEFQKNELKRAEFYASYYGLNLHYVDINWNVIKENIEKLMKHKGSPLHSIEPQIYQAALQAKKDGIELMIIGDAADSVFGGLDQLLSKDWSYDAFKERYSFLNPEKVLVNPIDMNIYFKKYRLNDGKIDFLGFLDEYSDIESYGSYENAFSTADLDYLDPYEVMKLSVPLDLNRIRNGESKYIIRALFKLKYPDYPVPEKIPMPRPVDTYFKNWSGPKRSEFKKNINIDAFSGNQKWQMWCLEYFLDMYE